MKVKNYIPVSSLLSFSKIILCSVFIVYAKTDAQTRDVTEMRKRLEPPAIGAMTVLSHRESLGENGERIVDWNYDVEGARYGESPRASIRVTWDPFGKIINGTRQMMEDGANASGYPYHYVDNWPVGLVQVTSTGSLFMTVKGNYMVVVSISYASSSAGAERLADEAFAYILSRIPEPSGSNDNAGVSAGDKLKATDSTGGKTGGKTAKQKTEAELKMEQAYKAFEEEREKYVAAEKEAAAALGVRYSEGAAAAEEAGNSVEALIEIIPPASRLSVFRDSEQRFGVAVANSSDFDIARVRLRLFVHTANGEKEIGKSRIDRVRRGDESTAAFSVSGKKLQKINKKHNIEDTDIEIKTEYKIFWNQYYYSSEKKDVLWANGLNPRLDGLPAEGEGSNAAPPRVRIELVDETGTPLQENLIVAGKSHYLRFSVESSTPEASCLAACSEPRWSTRPRELLYSPWGDAYNRQPPVELLPAMDRFNGKSNPRFSGNLMGDAIHFYAFFTAPSVKQDEDLIVTLPFRYTLDENLAGQEDFWRESEKSVTFTLTRGKASRDVSDVVQLNVTTWRHTDHTTVALVLPGGQVGRFRGSMVELVPTDRWWPGMLDKWRKRNKEMMNFDLSKKVKQNGIKQLAGDVVTAYDKSLGTGLAAAFAVEDIVGAQSKEEIVRETGKTAAGLLIPAGGVLLPLMEMGFMWAKRERQEAEMLRELNRTGPALPFKPATLYQSTDEPYGTRIMYKVIDKTLYFIPLGKTSL